MKTVSYWASQNILLSRLILIVGLVVIYWMGVFWGSFFYMTFSESHSSLFVIVPILLLTISAVKYPSRAEIKDMLKSGGGFFKRWKVYDLLLVMCMLFLGMHLGHDMQNNKVSENKTVEVVADIVSFVPMMQVGGINEMHQNRKSKVKKWIDKKQSLIKSFFNRLAFKVANSSSVFTKIMFILLGGIVTYILGAGLAFVSCTISCNGYPVLAIIALVLGIAGILSIVFFSGRSIMKKYYTRNGIHIGQMELNRESFYLTLMTVAAVALFFFVQISVV